MMNSLTSWRPGGRVHGGWGWIHTAWVASVLVTSFFSCTVAQLSVTPDVVTAAVGDTVTLSLRYVGHLIEVLWFRGRRIHADDRILGLFDSDPPIYGLKYTDRETALPDGSLRITDVQMNYTGNYTVQMFVDPGGLQQATAQLRVHGAPPASDAPISTWWVTLAVASGMLLGAAVAVLGVVLIYKRCTKKANDLTPGGSPIAIYEPAVNYVNVENTNQAQPAAQSPDADHTYMKLKHGDQALYGNLQRPQN
ncbi:cell adhesion molecule CEACAM8-like isoform X2 [Lissotriton helveticus]